MLKGKKLSANVNGCFCPLGLLTLAHQGLTWISRAGYTLEDKCVFMDEALALALRS